MISTYLTKKFFKENFETGKVAILPVHSDGHHVHEAGSNVSIEEEGKYSAQLGTQGPLFVHISESQCEHGDDDDDEDNEGDGGEDEDESDTDKDDAPGCCEGEVDGAEEKIRNSQTEFEIGF